MELVRDGVLEEEDALAAIGVEFNPVRVGQRRHLSIPLEGIDRCHYES
jgi:hypothetical protein